MRMAWAAVPGAAPITSLHLRRASVSATGAGHVKATPPLHPASLPPRGMLLCLMLRYLMLSYLMLQYLMLLPPRGMFARGKGGRGAR